MSIDLSTQVGSVRLPNPIMTASGTAGYGAELSAYFDLSAIGAVVVKSMSREPWKGNPAPRVHATAGGMVNSVGLQNHGVDAWLAEDLPKLLAARARVVASIWGFTVEDYAATAACLAGAPLEAVEVNLSCPNLDGGRHLFAHDPIATGDVVAACAAAGKPLWAKLSPNVENIVPIAAAAYDAGAEAVTLINTVMARVDERAGGLSGPAVRPIAVRAVWECREAFPDKGIVGVGGVSRGVDALELMRAGANAVQVGTATFADPRAPIKILRELAARQSARPAHRH